MCRMHVRGVKTIVLFVSVLAILPAACFNPAPPATAVLAGTWAVTSPSAGQLNQLLLTFDSNGNLQTISYQVSNNATITVPSPVGTTSVDGDNVTITSTFNNNGFVFEGVLNSEKTVINGTVTTQITSGDVVVTINRGAATLTKQ
jgi:hypothetical protein